jgi:hypothetical protein
MEYRYSERVVELIRKTIIVNYCLFLEKLNNN